MYDAKVYAPKIEVTIITEKENLVFRGTNIPLKYMDNYHLDWDIISCTVKRDLASDCPTFNMNLVYRNDWFRKVAPNDLIIIKMIRGNKDESLGVVLVGLVDDCRRHGNYNSTKPSRVVSITGRGIGKAFLQFDIGIVQETDIHVASIGWMVNNDINIQNSDAGDAIKAILTEFVRDRIFYNFGNDVSLKDFFKLDTENSTEEKLIDISSFVEYQGSLWSLFRELQGSPFNELYWEVVDNIPNLTCRKTPFNREDWEALPSIIITDTEVLEEDLGKSDLETYALYSVACKTFFSASDPKGTFGCFPLWYPPYQKKYGIRRLEVTTPYVIYAVAEDKDICITRINKYQAWLFDWNIKNNSMLNGSVTVGGSNKYKIGTRLNWNENEFYIEAVTHSFNAFTSYTTQLEVTRGIVPSERFTLPVGFRETFDPGTAVKYGIYSLVDDTQISNGEGSGSGIPTGATEEGASQVSKGNKKVPVYVQGNYPKIWNQTPKSIAQSGCGLCCVAMVAEYFSGKPQHPNTLADWTIKHPSSGETYTTFEDIARQYRASGGYNYNERTSWENMVNTVNSGGLGVVQLSWGKRYGLTGSESHFIVITEVQGSNFIVNDPNVGSVSYPIDKVSQATANCYAFSRR